MGSNLNLSGEIECDASIMDGKSLHYGAVGSISGELRLMFTFLHDCAAELKLSHLERTTSRVYPSNVLLIRSF